MIPDAEVLRMMYEILSGLELGDFLIKVNHRKILDGVFDVCGVPEAKFRTISSAVDKLDKAPWVDVRKEMVEEKGLDPAVADRIGEYVLLKGTTELLEKLLKDARLTANKRAKEGLEDIRLLLVYLQAFGVLHRVSFDLSLARGLDYYTGVIYEAILVGKEVGSVSGGGRYDDLVGMFDSNGAKVPCVGFSIGVERVFTILEEKAQKEGEIVRTSDVLVCSAGGDLTLERMTLACELWNAGIKAEITYKKNPKFLDQMEFSDKHNIPLVIIIGSDELQQGLIRVKQAGDRDSKGDTVPRNDAVAEIRRRLNARSGAQVTPAQVAPAQSTPASGSSPSVSFKTSNAGGKLHTYPNNPRAYKALIAAQYSKVKLDLAPHQFGVTTKDPAFLAKFPFGKVPALETNDGHFIAESNAISFYAAAAGNNQALLGKTASEAAEVQMYINIADNEITSAVATWLYPILGFIPYNKENTDKAKEDVKKALAALNTLLATRTYLVGEEPTLADVHIVLALLHPYKLVFDAAFRAPFGNVTRYFTTLVNQPEFKAILGEVSLCEAAAVYDPNNIPKASAPANPGSSSKGQKETAPKKEEAKKEAAPKKEEKPAAPAKEAEEEEEDYAQEEKKGPNPLDALPPSKFNLENWKRTVSNLEEKEAIKFFWENIDLEGFSLWIVDHKDNPHTRKVFMSSNLVGGFFQRLDSARKYVFGSFGIFGDDESNDVHGLFVFRGQDIPFEVQDCPDYDSYTFTKVTDFSEDSKKNVNAFIAWGEIDGLAKFSTITKKFNTGKNFK